MALDIAAYANATFVTDEEGDEWEDWDDHTWIVTGDFPERADGLQSGLYRIEQAGALFFPAGSYIGYGHWRNTITKELWGVEWLEDALVGRFDFERYVDQPFYELIDFTDTEGVIGPDTSAVLAEDFLTHRAEAREWFAGDTECGLRLYENFAAAFALATPDGLVSFR